MAALSRPHPDYPRLQYGPHPAIGPEPHNGKVAMRSFTEVGHFQRGPRAGQERIINVSVDRFGSPIYFLISM